MDVYENATNAYMAVNWCYAVNFPQNLMFIIKIILYR